MAQDRDGSRLWKGGESDDWAHQAASCTLVILILQELLLDAMGSNWLDYVITDCLFQL